MQAAWCEAQLHSPHPHWYKDSRQEGREERGKGGGCPGGEQEALRCLAPKNCHIVLRWLGQHPRQRKAGVTESACAGWLHGDPAGPGLFSQFFRASILKGRQSQGSLLFPEKGASSCSFGFFRVSGSPLPPVGSGDPLDQFCEALRNADDARSGRPGACCSHFLMPRLFPLGPGHAVMCFCS